MYKYMYVSTNVTLLPITKQKVCVFDGYSPCFYMIIWFSFKKISVSKYEYENEIEKEKEKKRPII